MIKPGDIVYIYHSESMKYLIQIPAGGRLSTHRGYIDYVDIAGRQYGDAVETHLGHRFHLLKPTVADMAMKVRRTTTISYPKDTGLMLLHSILSPGARVIETGSGSGALTSVLANFVRPDGRVYSYERRPEFSANAQTNLARYELAQYCEFHVGDPEVTGFRQVDVDAVFLDVPEPWSLLEASHRALKGGHGLVAVVPTMEQVRRTFTAMELSGFERIRVKEILERGMLVRPSGIRPADRMIGHTVYIVLAHKVNASVA